MNDADREIVDRLQHALEAIDIAIMPVDQREALRLRYLIGLPSKEIAERLKKSDGAVRVMLSRGIARLQTLLDVK